jgi:hypothetical protein
MMGIALVRALSLLSASPSLHRLIHKDADDANHECASGALSKFTNGGPVALPGAEPRLKSGGPE